MYAIIRTGGHQEKVSVGEQITVDRLKQEVGEEVRFVPLMIAKDDGSIVSDHRQLAEEAAVIGRVLEHVKGDKLDVFQYRQKTGYRRHTGHRSALTLVEIAELRIGDAVERAEEKRAAEEAAKQALALAEQARKEADAAAPKKVTPKKKPAAKAAGAKGGAKAGAKAGGAKAVAKAAKPPAKTPKKTDG
jgi:large subunit ribosomal protein L21